MRLSVTNTGRVAGAETVQVYVGDPAAAGEPPKQLKGFRKGSSGGETRRVRIQLDRSAFAYWNSSAGSAGPSRPAPTRSWSGTRRPACRCMPPSGSPAETALTSAGRQTAALDRDHERVRHQDREMTVAARRLPRRLEKLAAGI